MALKNDKNGLNRCPKCGATDVTLNMKSGKLKCNFCRTEFEEQSANANGGVEGLTGEHVSEGATNIIPDEKVVLTLKCPACGAEVVINTDEAVNARCHWCRHTLSLNEKMPNGAVPDLVLPFKLEKSRAEANIRAFVEKRQFFAHPKFKAEFTTENIMGVYLPYMVVDINSHATMSGEAEHLVRKYTVGSGDSRRTYYDANVFDVVREFDLLIDDLTVEASSDKLNQDICANTNNVINSIMPFDTENCLGWNPAYLKGFTSERRDTNIEVLKPVVKTQAGDVARYRVRESMQYYDRGAKWTKETIEIKGTSWKAAYLPVWLYSYLQDDGKKKLLHYVAVNARTGETMGSVPINKAKLILISTIIEIIGAIIGTWWIGYWLGVDMDDNNPWLFGALGYTPGFIFYWVKMNRYRNMNARHGHEKETKSTVENMKKTDNLRELRKGLSNSTIAGRNDNVVMGVIAKNGKKMMGEKMASYLGIGKMLGVDQDNENGKSKK